MNAPLLVIWLVLAGPSAARAEDPPRPAEGYRAWRGIADLVLGRCVFKPVNWLTQAVVLRAYKEIISLSEKTQDLSAEDLTAVGKCHAALGDRKQAAACFRRSLDKRPTADAHLALAFMLAVTDLAEADKQFEKATTLDPKHAELWAYPLLAARLLEARQDWSGAVPRLEKYLALLRETIAQRPQDPYPRRRAEEAGRDLDWVRRLEALTGQPAPPLKVRAWIQGERVDPVALKGKVVVLDFGTPESKASLRHMSLLQELQTRHGEKAVEVIGVMRLSRRAYDPDTGVTGFDPSLTPDQEKAGFLAFARKHGIRYRLGIVPAATYEEYGVGSAPQTVVLDQTGTVRLVMPWADGAGEKVLEQRVQSLLKTKP